MRNLIEFLYKNGIFIVFIALEVLCFRLVVEFNHRHTKIYQNTATAINGAINERMGAMFRYWKLDAVNDSLRAENAILREELVQRIARQASEPTFREMTVDTASIRYTVIPASVIQNSISKRNNYITLDRGSRHGIAKGMGVASEDSPVGIVVAASDRFSRVMSVLHSNAMLSATIKGKGYFGSLLWRGFNPTKMHLDAVPKHAQLYVGDTVVTSGYSQIFPPDLFVGTIDTFWLPRGSNFYNVVVTLGVDMSNLRSAYVFENEAGEEIEYLENLTGDEE